MHDPREAKQMLDLAARLAWRGWGHVEPNPLVGCVLVRPGTGPTADRIIGMGHHRRFGGVHAEVDALQNARARGHDPSGATGYITLEPCATQGKQPPCTDALVAAHIGRVVCARRDPHPSKGGGADRLEHAGIPVEFTTVSDKAIHLSDPFVKRITTGLPWVIAKWAQTIDGKIATRTGESKWISSDRSRRWVHLTRGRVDAIFTGIGTVKADDPLLTARDVPVRRVAARVVIDPGMDTPRRSRFLRSTQASEAIMLVEGGWPRQTADETAWTRDAGGPSIVPIRAKDGRLDLTAALRWLAENRGISAVLAECGPGMTSELWREHLIDELHVYVAPKLMGDTEAKPPLRGFVFEHIEDVPHMDLVLSKRVGADVLLVYRRPDDAATK